MTDDPAHIDPSAFLAEDDRPAVPSARGGDPVGGARLGGDPRVLDVLAERIAREGSIRFDEFMDVALYQPGGGFFAAGGGAGRAGGDFITSPEVGPLFGVLVARFLDRRWQELGRPDPFVVVEAAAGRGALAISVLAARPECARALRYVLVERSAALRARQAEHLALSHPFEVLGPEVDEDRGTAAVGLGEGPLVCSLEDLPHEPVHGVVLANELLDNVALRLMERTEEGWSEVRVTADASGLVELLVPADATTARRLDELAPEAPAGARVPWQAAAADWVRDALGVLRSGSLVVLDYVSTTPELAGRPMTAWLRTYRAHGRGGAPLDAPGSQDLTAEVAVDQLPAPARRTTQAEWLRGLGIDELVDQGRRQWAEHVGPPTVAAIRAQSRVPEAAALTDPDGLGAFGVLEWRV